MDYSDTGGCFQNKLSDYYEIHFFDNIYDDPFGGIYKFCGNFLSALLPIVEGEQAQNLQSLIHDRTNRTDNWYEAFSSQMELNTISTILFIISCFSIIIGIFLGLFIIVRSVMNRLNKSKETSKNQENRLKLTIRLGIICFLFCSILWCEIMYGVALAQMDKEQRSLNWKLGNIVRDVDHYQQNLNLDCIFTKSSKDEIISYFEKVNKDILDKCKVNDNGNHRREEQFLPPEMEKMIQKTISDNNKVMDMITNIQGDRIAYIASRRSVKTLPDYYFPVKNHPQYKVQKVQELLNSISQEIESFNTMKEMKKSDDWRIRYQRERILLTAQADTVASLINFAEKAQEIAKEAIEVAKNFSTWIKEIAKTAEDVYLQQLATREYNVNYVYYHATIGTVAALGLYFLGFAATAMLYKIIFPKGYSSFQKQERFIGKMLYAGFFFSIIALAFLTGTLKTISKSSMTLRRSCDSLINSNRFYDSQADFYGMNSKRFWKDASTIHPEYFRNDTSIQRIGMVMLGLFGYPQLLYPLNWSPTGLQTKIKASQENWMAEMANILADLEATEQYPFSISIINKIKSAVYEVTRIRDAYEDQPYKMKEKIEKLIQIYLNDLAYFDFPVVKNRAFELLPVSKNGSFITTTTSYYNSWNTPPLENECTIAVKDYQKNVFNLGRHTQEQMNDTMARFNAIFDVRPLRIMVKNTENAICKTFADPASSLLLFYVLNILLWLVTMIQLLKAARGWELGNEKRVFLVASTETLATPLIDAQKLEEAIYNNPIHEI